MSRPRDTRARASSSKRVRVNLALLAGLTLLSDPARHHTTPSLSHSRPPSLALPRRPTYPPPTTYTYLSPQLLSERVSDVHTPRPKSQSQSRCLPYALRTTARQGARVWCAVLRRRGIEILETPCQCKTICTSSSSSSPPHTLLFTLLFFLNATNSIISLVSVCDGCPRFS